MVISVATVLLTALAIYRISNRIAVFDGSQQAAIKSGKRQFGDKPLPIAGLSAVSLVRHDGRHASASLGASFPIPCRLKLSG